MLVFSILSDEIYCDGRSSSLGDSSTELQALFQEVFPYSYISTLTGDCLEWNEDFINKILFAFASDDLRAFSDAEEQVLRQFIEFEDLKSTSADTTLGVTGAIGCTIPDINGNSYVVTASGPTTTLCLDAQTQVAKEKVSASLDQVLMSIYNCENYNDCGLKTGDLEDVSPCSL